MKKSLKLFLSLSMIMAFVLTGCGAKETVKGSDTVKGTYTAVITGYDWGCGVSKIVLSLDNVVDAVTPETFTVVESKQSTDWAGNPMETIVAETTRTITDAYTCDADGVKTEGASQYVAIEMYCDPNTGSPLNYFLTTSMNAWCDPYELAVTATGLTSGGTEVTTFEINPVWAAKVTDADALVVDSFTATDGTTYNYGHYDVEGSKTLFVWLHGMGEGAATENTDPSITALANKVTALTRDPFQSTVGGMSVLVPQCPTMWMNEGEGMGMTGESIYLDSLHELIADYAAKVGAEKIVISGCSNGGYMTLSMALHYGNEYTAYIPICEAIDDKAISDEKINEIKDLPLYFIYSLDDTTVDPKQCEEPTISRLNAAGATNLHVSTSEHVVDTSGQYTNEDGTPYMYAGHWSWIYFDNNEANCDCHGTEVFSWIAEQVK